MHQCRRRLPALPRWLACALVLVGLLGAQPAGAQSRAAPEAATGWRAAPAATARRFMVAAANPHAVEAGLALLRRGGTAADAAVAVQLVLNLVEPQSSGLGGGAMALYWDAASQRITGLDGRETAPLAARPDRFLAGAAPLPFAAAVVSGLSVGAPGTLRLLHRLHTAHGRLPWPEVIAPAVALARQGFRVSARLHGLLSATPPGTFAPAARAYFFDRQGVPWPEGHLLRNEAFAATLEQIARAGPDAFYRGAIAQEIVAAVRDGHGRRGDLTLQDLAQYRVVERPPVCSAYRGHRICGMAPPSSGGIAIAQVLALLEPFDLGQGPAAAMRPQALHLVAEAQKLAYADRDHFLADPDVVPAPPGLLDSTYLAQRRTLISRDRAMPRPLPGSPPAARLDHGTDATREMAGTSHFSIVDADRNAVSFTTTIEAGFGSRLWAGGFLLNNELTDFSFRPVDRQGRAIANAVGPGKRPRSSMSPTIVFDAQNRPWAVLGSVGGTRIPLYVTKALIALIDWKLDAQQAAAAMNFGSRGGAFELESSFGTAIWAGLHLKSKGHSVHAGVLTSGTHIVVLRPDGTLEGGADPRREGVARGD